MEWITDVSNASVADRGGKIPGRRAANMGFPEPGVPTIIKWCRPAAAISSVRFARSWPLTSMRSLELRVCVTSPGSEGSIGNWPVKWRTTSPKVAVAITWALPTHAASAPDSNGHNTLRFCSVAAIAVGRAPITGTSVPSRENSPKATWVSATSGGMISRAQRRATAMGRSKCYPTLGRFAGDRLIATRFEGIAIVILLRTVRTRSRASDTALSGSPTIEKAGRPAVTAHCTSTWRASIP